MSWTPAELTRLKALASQDKYFALEIAKTMGRKAQDVRHQLKRMNMPARNFQKHRVGKWNCKHAHLDYDLLVYYLDHSADECKKKFKFSDSEFKSCLTRAYLIPEYRGIRKDTRTHKSYSTRELKFLLRHTGLMPRDWIGQKLGRGQNGVVIKERLEKLGISSRTLNGITLSQFRLAFGKEPDFVLHTKAGPGRNGTPTYFQIIPWVYLNQEFKTKKLLAPKSFRQVAATMALFQDWIFEGDPVPKMQRICRKSIGGFK